MTLGQTLQQRWQQLSRREQRWLALAVAVLAFALVYALGIAPARKVLAAAPEQHRKLDAQLQQMHQLQQQAQSLRAQAPLSADEARVALEQSVKPLGASAQMAVQATRVTVTFNNVTADPLAQWLANVRQNARISPTDAHLKRNAQGGWDGSVVLHLSAA